MNITKHAQWAMCQISFIVLYTCSFLLITSGISYGEAEHGMMGGGLLYLTIVLHIRMQRKIDNIITQELS